MIFEKNFARNQEKNNAWNIRRMVDESFVPASQQASILHCRLSDFKFYCLSTNWKKLEIKNCNYKQCSFLVCY